MLIRTHLAFGLFLALFLFPAVLNKWIFVSVVLIASILPDVDSMHSFLGNYKIFRPLQWFVKHRGLLHSVSLCLVVSGFFALFAPVLALPFFVGYAGHLLADSWTVMGIRPFWPLKKEVNGKIKTGGLFEKYFFVFLIVLNLFLFIRIW